MIKIVILLHDKFKGTSSKLMQMSLNFWPSYVFYDRLGNFTLRKNPQMTELSDPNLRIQKKKKKKEKLLLQNIKTSLETVQNLGESYDTKDERVSCICRAEQIEDGWYEDAICCARVAHGRTLFADWRNIYGQYEVAWSCKILDLFRRPGIIQNPCSCDCSR